MGSTLLGTKPRSLVAQVRTLYGELSQYVLVLVQSPSSIGALRPIEPDSRG